MKLNLRGIYIVANYEGFESKPYLCPAGVPTIGYGTTRYKNGKKVTLNDPEITQEAAYSILLYFMDKVADQIRKVLTVELNDNQFSALCSLVYNIGLGNFKKSSVLKLVNANPNSPKIGDAIKLWNKATVNGKKQVLAGLVKRRESEANLYFLTFNK